MDSKKKYLVITPFFPTKTSFRGPFILDQIKAIERNSNFEVIVMRPKKFYSRLSDYEFEGVQVRYFNVFELPSNFLPGLFNFFSGISLLRQLKKHNIDINTLSVVHAHTIHMGYLANLLKKKAGQIMTLLQHHGLDVLGLKMGRLKSINWHKDWISRYGTTVCNSIDMHIGVSRATLSGFGQFPGITLKRQYVLYNGVDLNKFYPGKNLRSPGTYTIGCIGNFIELKDHITLIKAVEKLVQSGIRNISVRFVGSGPTLNDCKKYISQHALEPYFHFQGEVFHYELLDFYNSIDLFVLPSFYEAFGCVYLESFACGTPFIGVKRQGISEYISPDETDKWLIEPGDYMSLKERIQNQMNSGYSQHLNYPIDINILVPGFLANLQELST